VDWGILWQYRGALASGLLVTIGVSVLGIIGSTILGVLVGCLGTLPSLLLRRLAGLYSEFLRNLPLIVKLFFLYAIVSLPAVWAAVAALVLHQSAYIADITRSGIRSVASGQLDAALSLGHSYRQAFFYVVVPQTVRVMVPPMTTQFVSVIKNSSVTALISIQDLTWQTQEINVETFRGFEAATATTVLYIIVATVVIAGMTRLQSRLAVR
jgi:His/Glu/Gln/Arg/opine family amino acid ABC transporter permease subunit